MISIGNYNFIFGKMDLMNMIDTLKTKLEQTTKDFYTLYDENKQLKQRVAQLEEKNSILTRKTQDLVLTINSRLKKGNTH